jgi:hypothetical protein
LFNPKFKEEESMTFEMKIQPGPISLFAFLFALVLAVMPSGVAAQSSTEQIKIVGHLDLQGIHVKHIFMQRSGDKCYLYLLRPTKNAFAIVEVTNPEKPVLVDRAALQAPPGGSVDLPEAGSVLAIALTPDQSSGTTTGSSPVSLPTESVRLLDLTDPKHPKVLKTFNGVTSINADSGRKLIFIANSDGLWIVSHNHERPLPMCSSDTEISSLPNCQ